MKLAALFLAVGLALATPGVASADTTVTTLSDHDTTIVNGQKYVALTPPATYAAAEYRDSANGSVGHRFELRDGDVRPQDQQLHGDNRQRDELVGLTHYAVRADLWFSFSYQWSGQMPSTWVSLANLFSDKDACDAGRSAAFAIQQIDGDLVVQTRSDAAACSATNPDPVVLYTQHPFPAADTWHRFVGHVSFNPFGPTGSVKLWIDGKQVVRTVQIPLGYNDAVGPHFTFSQYRAASPATLVFKYANEEAGTASLLDRINNPLPLPAGL